MTMLRTLFGPSKEEIWRQLSAEIDGRYVDGGFGKGNRVEATHGEWTVTLDTYVVPAGKTFITFTRMRAPYVNPGGFRFTIYRKSVFSEVAKWLGMQDIRVDHEPFDQDFIIKGTDEASVRRLFSNPRIRELIASAAVDLPLGQGRRRLVRGRVPGRGRRAALQGPGRDQRTSNA